MNVNNLEKINDIFSDYINFSNVDFAKIYDQYINKTFFTPKEESLLSKAYNEQIKQSIFSNIKYTFSSIENATTTIEYIYYIYKEQNKVNKTRSRRLITKIHKNLPEISYEDFIYIYTNRRYNLMYKYVSNMYVNLLKNRSSSFKNLWEKKVNFEESQQNILKIYQMISSEKKVKHPTHISIYLVYSLGENISYHATCLFKFTNKLFVEFSHYGGGNNLLSIKEEDYKKSSEKNVYEYDIDTIARRICHKKIPKKLSTYITLQTLLNIALLWWTRTDAIGHKNYPGSCTGLVETALVLSGLTEGKICNVDVYGGSSFSFKSTPLIRSPNRKSPNRKSPNRKSPNRKSPNRKSKSHRRTRS